MVRVLSFEMGVGAKGLDLSGIDVEELNWIDMNFLGINRISKSYRIIYVPMRPKAIKRRVICMASSLRISVIICCY
jgi:hypothetical protein